MFMINLHYVGAFINIHLLVEAQLHDDVNAKEALNHVLQKNIIIQWPMPKIYRDFVDFVENWGSFFYTP